MSAAFDLRSKVAIITGASRGIGKAIAAELARAGCAVVLSSRRQAALDEVAAEITAAGGKALAIAAHNGDKAALQKLVGRAQAQYGRLDILVNNAATNPHFGKILAAEDSHWRKTLDVNLLGNVWLTQAAAPVMRRSGGGKIINVASIVGLQPGHHQGIYSISKAAVISLTQTLAQELGADNIQVNAIAPGLVQTKFAQALWGNPELLAQALAQTPAGRIGQPQDIAGLALLLASPAADFISGAVFVADGGLTAKSL
ncbi:MAG: glucose 1-dehydrogenase [Chloroflexi bacterium]|nr:glucose 1-dehydrogenase [Chloroflexota bacterium]